MAKWYFNVQQTERVIRIEIRPNEGNEGGYISARKRHGHQGLMPAVIDRNLAIADSLYPEEVNQLVEWLQLAVHLAGQLDERIKTVADFKKRLNVKQYNSGVWQSCYVFPAEEDSTNV